MKYSSFVYQLFKHFLPQNRGIYFFRLDDNRVIDATLSGGLARYVNHSCDPNCVTECVQIGNENKILIIANRRIQAGEEVRLFLRLLNYSND